MEVKVWSNEDEEAFWEHLFDDELGFAPEHARKLSSECPYLVYGIFDNPNMPPKSMFLAGIEYARIW